MTSLAIINIATLATCDPHLGMVPRATLVIEDGVVAYAGPEATAPRGVEETFDAGGRAALPGFVDSHTHLIFAGDRAGEFVRRMAGQPYRPGGIMETVASTRDASDEQLESNARRLIADALSSGTTTVEIKTGYGLTPAHESRQLAIAARLSGDPTFLGAHLVPPGIDRDRYLSQLTDEMIPSAAGIARWCDVFCEDGAFDGQESRTILEAARGHGFGLRVHANQLSAGPGVQLACEIGAASADHCTYLSDADVDALASSGTVATLLPISDFCTRQPYADGRRLIDAGATVALATNCNPGSSYSTSMPLALALAVRECGLTVDEAIHAATAGGAAALQRPDLGRLSPGATADFIILDAPTPEHLVYQIGRNPIWAVFKAGVCRQLREA